MQIAINYFDLMWNVKPDNLWYNTKGFFVDRLINQTSDGSSIILIDWK